jgi:hypothetical protein
MIDIIEKPRDATASASTLSQPTGWYDPDSSAFEPLAGAAAVTDVVASSLAADRTIDATSDEGTKAEPAR